MGSGDLKMRESSGAEICDDTGVIEDLLKLGGRGGTIAVEKIGLATQIDGIQRSGVILRGLREIDADMVFRGGEESRTLVGVVGRLGASRMLQERWYYPVGGEPMEPTRPKLPSEAVELYNKFIHGGMSRRAFMDGVQRLAIGGLAASTIIEALMPNYGLGQQVSKTDDRIKTSYETVPSPKGNGSIKGYLVRPISADTRSATVTKLPGIIVIHENRGLNPHIEDIARRLALANFMAFAPDGLTSLGGFPGDDYKGGLLFNKIDRAKMFEDMLAAAEWLKARPDCTGKIGATGFCYGGGVANALAVQMGTDLTAAVPYYGRVPPTQDIPRIKAAILVHNGELDKDGAASWPAYDQALTAANVVHEGYIYPGAVHGFNCDATPERYNKTAADLSWQRTIDWFNKYTRG
jgi:carboxymethylenebutenolidase